MIPLNGLQATPCVDCGGLGLKMYQEKDGLRVWVTIVFHLIHPHVVFCASIDNGSIEANLQLAGGAGVTVTLDAASSQEFTGGNIKETGLIPLDITVPIGGIFLPLQIDLSQSIDMASAFSAKTSRLHGAGGIDLTGEIAADYHKGAWEITPPQGQVKQNLAGMVTGISVGINSMVFAISQRLMVGVGALSFATGPYVDLISSVTSLKGSSIGTTLLNPDTYLRPGNLQHEPWRRNRLQHAKDRGKCTQHCARLVWGKACSSLGKYCCPSAQKDLDRSQG